MKVLMSAYACEPGKGSEPEVGWRWMLEMSMLHDITVITRSNNQPVIESYLKNNPELEVNVRFVYYDLPRVFLKLKKLTNILNWYYCFWQFRARKKINSIIEEANIDLVHLVTFASFRYPVFLRKLAVPVVWGPIGGAELAPWRLLWHRLRFPACIKEAVRNLATYLSSTTVGWNNPIKTSGGRAIASTPRTQMVLNRKGIFCSVLPTIGMDMMSEEKGYQPINVEREIRFIFVGRLVLLKGVHFLIEALAAQPLKSATLTIVGDGEDRKFLENLVKEFGIQDRVEFLGQTPKEDLPDLYRSHHVVVAPSLYESGGFTVLEGFQQYRPAIAFKVGGLAISIDETCGKLVDQQSASESIKGLSEAMQFYVDNTDMISVHGRAGYKKLHENYSWDMKASKMDFYYKASVKDPHLPGQKKSDIESSAV